MRMNSAARLSAACAIFLVFTVGAHAQQKPCATASKFGPDDQIGNLNHVTPAKTLAASKLVTKGKAYRLGIETNKDTPAYGTRTFAITVLQPGQAGGASLGPTKTTYNDDIITGWVGVGSQLDGLATPASTTLFQLQQGCRLRNARRPEEAGHRECAAPLLRVACCSTWPVTSIATW